ncbi:Long-chain-fatty-acid--CoA ligase 5 [Coemansia sp. RSA 2337]|nr:Long-chain-fatty-acid--CoA ligase 5 [Coemansia sp. RSA 2337]
MGHIIEPERIEYVLCNCDIVSHVFIYGDWEHASLVAVVVLDPEFLKVFLSKKNILKEGSEPPHHQMLCIDTVVKDVAIIGLIRDGVKRSLSYYDPVSNVYLEPYEFNIYGLLTPTLKIKRYDAIRHYQVTTNRLHEEIGSDATRYGLVRVGKAAAAVQQVPVVKDSDATEVVADEVVADEDEANDVAAAAMQQAPVVEDSDATEVIAAGDVGTVGEVETDNMAATVVQQVPVVDDNDVENEQPMPWRRTHRGKRAGVRERARAGRRLERLSAAAGQQSDEDQVPTSAFNSNNRRN